MQSVIFSHVATDQTLTEPKPQSGLFQLMMKQELLEPRTTLGRTMQPPAQARTEKRVGMWNAPAIIAENNFIYKSLSNWAFNIAIGCSHACRFCYVPRAASFKQGA